MKNLLKVLLIFSFTFLIIAFSRTAPTGQEMPEYCTFFIEQDEETSPVITLDGTTQIEPEITEELTEYQILLPRSDNGRGDGNIHYSNPVLPIGDTHNYVFIEEPANADSRLFSGTVNEDSELIFKIDDLSKRGNFALYKVLTIEEVEQCNQFLEIDIVSSFQVDGLVYIPLKEYGIMDQFAMGIKVPYVQNDTDTDSNKSENYEPDVGLSPDGEGGSYQSDGPPPGGEGGPNQPNDPPPDIDT